MHLIFLLPQNCKFANGKGGQPKQRQRNQDEHIFLLNIPIHVGRCEWECVCFVEYIFSSAPFIVWRGNEDDDVDKTNPFGAILEHF